MTVIHKQSGTVEAAPGKPLRIVLTSSAIDRVGDRVVPEGGSLENFKKCPSLLLSHNHDALVGKVVDLVVTPGRDIVGTAVFHEETELSRQAKTLCERGYLNGVSIGFAPLTPPVPIQATANGRQGFEYRSWELLEATLCAVPANPACTVLRSIVNSGRLEGQKLAPVLRKSLREAMRQPRPKKEKSVSETKAMGEGGLAAGGAAVPPAGGEAMADPAAGAAGSPGDANDMAAKIGELAQQIAGLVALVKPAAPAAAPSATASPLDSLGGDDPSADEDDGDDGIEDDDELGGEAEDDLFGDEEEEEEEDEDDALARYRQRSRKAPVKKAVPPMKIKSMKAHAACIKEAMDHLGAMGEMAPGSAWTGMHQSSCKYHHQKMGEMCKAMAELAEEDGKPGEEEPKAPTDDKTTSITPEALKAAIAVGMKSATVPFAEAYYRLTGRRVS